MQSKSDFLISLDIRDNAAVVLVLCLLFGRVSILFARRVILPAVQKMCRDFLLRAAPELIDVAMKNKSSKQASKNNCKKTTRSWYTLLKVITDLITNKKVSRC